MVGIGWRESPFKSPSARRKRCASIRILRFGHHNDVNTDFEFHLSRVAFRIIQDHRLENGSRVKTQKFNEQEGIELHAFR
jgi:hypothetical protein